MKLEDVKIGMQVVPHQKTRHLRKDPKATYISWGKFIKASGYKPGAPCWVDSFAGQCVWLRTREKSAATWAFLSEDFTLYEDTVGKEILWLAHGGRHEFVGWFDQKAHARYLKAALKKDSSGNYVSNDESWEEFKKRCLDAAILPEFITEAPCRPYSERRHRLCIFGELCDTPPTAEETANSISKAIGEEIQKSFDETKEKLADRFNDDKLQWHLVDFKALEPMVQVLMKGAEKYAPFNWQRGLHYSGLFDSLQRHLVAFMSGEDLDPETGLPHVGHAMCNLMFLSWMQQNKPEMDDRIK